jgi:hypothetical protein
MLAGDCAGAQKHLDEAMALSLRIGERVYIVPVLVLQGRIHATQGDADAARKSLRAALEEARAQQAPWLELMALVALCELKKPAKEDRVALKEARGRINGGSDTVLVQRADQLIGKTS